MNRQEGFTLIESMAAIVIVAIGMLAMVTMLLMAMQVNQASEHRTDAAGVAQSVLENISVRAAIAGYTSANARNDATTQLGAGSIYTPSVGHATFPDFVVIPSPTSAGGSADIVVSLNWSEHGVDKNITLRSRVVVP